MLPDVDVVNVRQSDSPVLPFPKTSLGMLRYGPLLSMIAPFYLGWLSRPAKPNSCVLVKFHSTRSTVWRTSGETMPTLL